MPEDGCDPVAGRAAQVEGDMHTGDIVIIKVLHDGVQEAFADCDLPVRAEGEVFGAALKRALELRTVHGEGHERVREDIGRDDIAHRDVPIKAAHGVSKARAGDVRA